MQLKRASSTVSRASARGLSIVELMIGVAIGLFILAGATLAVTGQLSENRRMLSDTRVQQDLRAAADIISHDVRRAGYHDLAYTFASPSAPPNASAAASAAFIQASAYAPMTPASGPTTQVVYSFSQAGTPGQNGVLNAPLNSEVSGFRYNARAKTIEMQLGTDSGWQALTDPASVLITSFAITVNSWNQAVPCAQQCPVGPNNRALNLSTRNVVFTIVGQSATDASVVRSLSGTVRIRNDIVLEAGP